MMGRFMSRMISPTRVARAALLICLAGASCSATAWGTLLLIERPSESGSFALGPSLWTLPVYPGARGVQSILIPGVDYYAPSGFFASTDTALGWNMSQRVDLQTGLRLWPQLGRKARDLPPGIEPIGTRLQAEGFLNFKMLPVLLLQSGVLYGGGRHHDGAQIEVGATTGLPIGPDLLGIGLAASYANRSYRESYFGVSSKESAASGIRAWPVLDGWQDISITFSGEHRLNRNWRLDAQLVAARLIGAAARPPLMQSRRQIGGTLALWYEF